MGRSGQHAHSHRQAAPARGGALHRQLLELKPSALGLSTGANADARGDWPTLIGEAERFGREALELSALGMAELPSLAQYLAEHGRPSIPHLSVHGPAKGVPEDPAEMVGVLTQLNVGSIIMHPDVMGDPEAYRTLGSALVLENMDRRKPIGAFVDDLAALFGVLPEAGFCLDLPHVKTLDPTMELARQLIAAHGQRLREIHLSGIDEGCHHVPMRAADIDFYTPILRELRHIPWIVESELAER